MTEEISYEAACEYLLGIPKFTGKHTGEHTKAFIDSLDIGDLGSKVIHVAGTNGKGSVCSYLHAILTAAGYHTVLFTSPHLVQMTERFTIDGKRIDQALFLKAFLTIRALCERMKQEQGLSHPTFFEFLFLMLLVICKDTDPDFVILETGLGGRLDATNAFSKPALCVITKIGMDHMAYLGDTKQQIAAEKAGIIKAGVPLIMQKSCPESDAVLVAKADQLGATVYPVSASENGVKIKPKNIDFSYQSHYYSIGLSLPGHALYQVVNVKTAILAYEIVEQNAQKRLSADALRQVVERHVWPGRMEEILPGVILDGAHNEDGMESFLASVGADGATNGRSLILAFSADKDVDGMLSRVEACGLFDVYYATAYQEGRSLSPALLTEMMTQKGLRAVSCKTVSEAIRLAAKERSEGAPIYIAGSLYLVGEVKKLDEDGILRGMIE
ncbi:MAG: bifunctional folylpolyglutamate synthase/dihydrofolate synthase [Lachnospiraceae bacterium]|nr:bifunctional folylpolyglutamate synthase/dihydrofolate synthase [Lachnospiraceae bacterium]